jgi:hypothetical protein
MTHFFISVARVVRGMYFTVGRYGKQKTGSETLAPGTVGSWKVWRSPKDALTLELVSTEYREGTRSSSKRRKMVESLITVDSIHNLHHVFTEILVEVVYGTQTYSILHKISSKQVQCQPPTYSELHRILVAQTF